jgi:hypothetical protein
METRQNTAKVSMKPEAVPVGCKYSMTCPQFCVGEQPLCNGSYEHTYAFSLWKAPGWVQAAGQAPA